LRTTTLRQVRSIVAVLALTALTGLAWGASATGTAGNSHLDDLRRQALTCERNSDWLGACRCYEEILRKDRGQAGPRDGYQRCLRRFHLVTRHRDTSYRQVLTRLTPAQALDVYEQVLSTVAAAYVDRNKAQWTVLFQQGVQELRLALEDTVFVQEQLAGAMPEVLAAFRDKLDGWRDRKVANRGEAREQVLAVVRAGQAVGLLPGPGWITAVALEFAAGACNALDEYTLFLTPGSFLDAQAALRGKLSSVGIVVDRDRDLMKVVRVYPRSPAREAGVQRGDIIRKINGETMDNLTAEQVDEKLRGSPGSVVKIEVLPLGQGEPRVLELTRRPLVVPSVDHDLQTVTTEMREAIPIGLLRISHFQESTVQEVKEALASLQTDGMRVLILDLRGNPGGLFQSGVDVAKLFLGEGVIVITQSQHPKYNGSIRADVANPLEVPMVVLIDGETASAAEVLAGALKENRRALLVGQTTFGKGSIQCVIPLDKPPLDKLPGGIRITVARFYSPTRQPYTGVGVLPDIPFAPYGDPVAEAQRLLLGMLRPMPMMEPMGAPR
jgi:carboxyl-terminal processing protease